MIDITTPKSLVATDTKEVEEVYRNLSVADFMDDRSERIRILNSRWSNLRDNVTALVATDCDSVRSVIELAEVRCHLFDFFL